MVARGGEEEEGDDDDVGYIKLDFGCGALLFIKSFFF